MNIYHLPKEEQARWLEAGGKPVWDNWLKKMNAAGHPEAKEILSQVGSIMQSGEAGKSIQVKIAGHTDKSGTEDQKYFL